MITIQILNGLVYGSLLMIMASGLVLIYGLRRVVNFAHGSLYMLGAYIAYSASQHLSFGVALLASVLILAVLGFCLDRFGFRLLQERDPLTVMLVTFGLMLIFEDLVQSVWGKQSYSLATPAVLQGSVDLFGTPFPVYRLLIIVVGLAVAAGLIAWLRLSRIGLFIRAASTDPVTTAMQGVNTDQISGGVVAVGGALAGLAGVVSGPFMSLAPTMGSDILIDSFVVVVIGGLGSFSGAFAAAMLLGQLQALGAVYLPELAALLPFVLMTAVLIWRPSGIAGSRV
jgi:branched-chain amino acid transport system permease protein